MDNRILVTIGLIGGVLATAGVFGSWTSMSGIIMGEKFLVSASAWDSITEAEKTITIAGTPFSASIGRETYSFLALTGGILALIGALGALASPRMKILIALLAIGGILAIVGASWGYSDISSEVGALFPSVEIGIDYGLYMCLIGGILALISSSIMSVRGK